MENKEKKDAVYDLIYLCACVLNGVTPDSSRAAQMNQEALLKKSKFHDVPALCCYALESAGIKNEEFVKLKNMAIRKVMMLDAERKQILSYFEKSGIWYMALKGVYLKEYYPKIGMREMGDNDILVDESRLDDIDRFMLERGYEEPEHRGQNDWGYHKKPLYNYEMHRSLFGDYHKKALYDYYADIKKKLIKDDDNEYGYHFRDEDFYIYMVTHEYKHYIIGGTGLRSLTDTYVFIKKHESLDWDYIEDECSRLGIDEFEKNNREIALKILSSPEFPELTEKESDMLDYILTSGTYGTLQHHTENRVAELKEKTGSSSGFKYIMHRLFPPMDIFRVYYPFFYKHKVLLPVGWLYRLIRGIFKKNDMIKSELKYISEEDKTKK